MIKTKVFLTHLLVIIIPWSLIEHVKHMNYGGLAFFAIHSSLKLSYNTISRSKSKDKKIADFR